MKEFLQKYRHAVPLLLYGLIYMLWFAHLETSMHFDMRIIHTWVDDYIPFCEYFVIPYLLWFLYVATVIVYLMFQEKDSYYRALLFLATGMTVFLIISTIWPNGHRLRPLVMPRDNIFTQLIRTLYNSDPATSLWPSIHVYNSLGAHFAVSHCKKLEKHKVIRFGSLLLSISIILSTMFIKQHSVFDVITAFVMATVMYVLVYRLDAAEELRARFSNRKKRRAIEL